MDVGSEGGKEKRNTKGESRSSVSSGEEGSQPMVTFQRVSKAGMFLVENGDDVRLARLRKLGDRRTRERREGEGLLKERAFSKTRREQGREGER